MPPHRGCARDRSGRRPPPPPRDAAGSRRACEQQRKTSPHRPRRDDAGRRIERNGDAWDGCNRRGEPRCGNGRNRLARGDDRPWRAVASGDRDGRSWAVGRGQQRERVFVGEAVGLASNAEMQPSVASGDGTDRRTRADRRPRADGHVRQRQVADAAAAAANAHHAPVTRDRPGMDHRSAARGPDRRPRTSGEVGAAVRTGRERRGGGVREGARDPAWDRPQPSLSQGGGGDRQRHQDRGHEGHGGSRDGKSGRERGGAHEANLWPCGRGWPGCAWIGADLVQSCCERACFVRSSLGRQVLVRAPAAVYTGMARRTWNAHPIRPRNRRYAPSRPNSSGSRVPRPSLPSMPAVRQRRGTQKRAARRHHFSATAL